MVRSWVLTATLFLAVVPVLCHDRDAVVLEGIRTSFGVPGLAAAVVRNEATHKEAVGFRHIDKPVKLRDTDKFHLGSNTKAMTATLIGMLVDQGALGWNTTLSEALPDYAEKIVEGHRQTTIGMLSAHRSGIRSDFLTDVEFLNKLYQLGPVDGRRAVTERVLGQKPHEVPGTYFYDNSNYMILGKIVECLTHNGKSSWEEIMVDRIFSPLGMDCGFGTLPESSETSTDSPWGHMVANATARPEPVGGPLASRDYPTAFGPAGLVHCDMDSYAIWTTLHINGFNGRPTSLDISQETFKKLHSPYSSTNPAETYTYGGWIYSDGASTPWSNGPTLSHDGSNLAYYTLASLAPRLGDHGAALAVYTNAGISMDGAEGPATNAAIAAFDAITEGRLFEQPDTR